MKHAFLPKWWQGFNSTHASVLRYRALPHSAQNRLGPVRDTKLVEDMKQVVFDRMLTQVQRLSHRAIAAAFGQQIQDLLLADAQYHIAIRVYDLQRLRPRKRLNQKIELLTGSPYLPA